MRVIAGKARSMPLKTLDGIHTRPTQDRIKETIFNVLQNDVVNSIFIDLFSGCGGIGIEALSRGAKKAYFVEKNNKACSIIKGNLTFTKLEENAIVVAKDALSALAMINEDKVDIIYMDPPYNEAHEERILEFLGGLKFITEDTIIVIEAALKTDFDFVNKTEFEIVKEKLYKTNKHVFVARRGDIK